MQGFLDCPEIADCAPEDKDTETNDLERRARALLSVPPGKEKEKNWAEVFDAQKSVIGMLTDTLHEIKRTNEQYNFGSKLVRLVDTALEKLP